MDLTVNVYATFDRLREYCYRVAGTVGLCCVHVFGFSEPHAPELAERMGIAFQITNILRDVPKDFAMGRIYLPLDDMARFGCDARDLRQTHADAKFVELIRFEAERAWQFYSEGVAASRFG